MIYLQYNGFAYVWYLCMIFYESIFGNIEVEVLFFYGVNISGLTSKYIPNNEQFLVVKENLHDLKQNQRSEILMLGLCHNSFIV